MSLSTQTLKRLPKIKAGLLQGLNYTQIGARCRVSEKTIDRDVKAFVESGEFYVWVKQEWARMYAVIQREEPVEAFRNLTKLLGRMVTRKIEAHTVEEIREIKLMWIKDDTRTTDKIQATPRAKRVSQ